MGKRLDEVLSDVAISNDVEQEERSVLRHGSAALDTIREYSHGPQPNRWLAETRAPVRAPDRSVVGLVGITRDVTERLTTRQALGESEELLRKQKNMLNSILEGLAEGVVVTDQLGNFLLCNREAVRILGVDANALSVENWATVCELYESDNETPLTGANNPLMRAVAGDELTEVEVCVRKADQLRARVGVSATPLRNDDGVVVGGIGSLRDVTEQRDSEQPAAAVAEDGGGRPARRRRRARLQQPAHRDHELRRAAAARIAAAADAQATRGRQIRERRRAGRAR